VFIRVAIAILACLLTIWAVRSFAAPAPWYLWQSRVDGHTLCLQYPPGDGWQLAAGPFRDARCTRPTVRPEGR
jgi:hypothetical protein